MNRRIATLLPLLVLTTAAVTPSQPAPLLIYAAGSSTGALGAMLKRYTVETGQKVELKTGPAGLLREKIEAGDPVDLFVSANMAHPQKLTDAGKATATVVFAHNRVCVTAHPDVGLTTANVLAKLLDPTVRIGTSTPGADPGGDYAWVLFDKVDRIRPGAGAVLKAKAQKLVGGRSDPAVPPGQNAVKYLMATHRVDVFIGYCSSHEATPDKSVDKVELPEQLSVKVDYGMTVMKQSPDIARREAADSLALWLLSPEAQRLMLPYGFTPANQ